MNVDTVKKVVIQNPSYPESKTDIWEVELLNITFPKGYMIGKSDTNLFLVCKDHTLENANYAIVDRRSYTNENIHEKLIELLVLIK